MKRKRRIEITTFTEHSIVIRHSAVSRPLWCDGCAEEVTTVTTDQAAVIARVCARTVFRWIENGTLHFMEDRRRTAAGLFEVSGDEPFTLGSAANSTA